jgi:acyl dehydratase
VSHGPTEELRWPVISRAAERAQVLGGPIYADDLTVGEIFPVGEWTFTATEILEFASRWDPLPIHIDQAAAASGPFGVLIASGIHTIAVMQRLSVEAFYGYTAIVAGRRILETLFLDPVCAGAELRGEVEIIEVAIRNRGDALVTTRSRLLDGESVVYQADGESVWARR